MNKKKIKYLEKKELLKFLDSSKEFGLRHDYEIFTLLAYTGLRVGELCALTWEDINFNNRTININKTLVTYNRIEDFEITEPKTKTSIRNIEITTNIIDILKTLKKDQVTHLNEKNRLCFDRYSNVKKRMLPYNKNIIRKQMKRLLQLSNLNTDLSPHSLRHTHASLLAESGAQLHEIQQRLGHKNDRITTQIYLHVTKTAKHKTAERFYKFMENT